jgi:hydrophobic/amphiphilic exporter-1 (mainly G- bacteria), HAE1 family
VSRLYASPLRVYLCLGALAVAGVYSGLKLPISLFPNSSKPNVQVEVSYGNLSPEEFLRAHGGDLESQLRAIQTDRMEVEKVTATYNRSRAQYAVSFKWGVPDREAKQEVRRTVDAFAGRFTDEVRQSIGVWTGNDNGGFFAASFYSPKRSLDEVYDLVEPLFSPALSRVPDAASADIWNPTKKEVRIELRPSTLASLGLFPRDVDRAVTAALGGRSGGSVTVGTNQLSVLMPRTATTLDDLGAVLVPTPAGRAVHLRDIARIDYGIQTSQNKSWRTSGAPSILIYAAPRPGGNIKRMAEDIIAIMESEGKKLPADIQSRILVDPSAFIRAAVNNVFHEVAVGALLAVAILFLFIGSFRNVVTAAIEIPLSMVLAFILMRMSGMNLNLISLGGLALSAGMNVDASVVVMENIFRHVGEAPRRLGAADKLRIIGRAVAEVRFAVIASTVASLVVFLPLAFTSDLTYAILGDLAKTVVFSHGLSMFVALILVPTVRLHLMSRPGAAEEPHSPAERHIRRLEEGYARALGAFLARPRLRLATYAGVVATLALLAALVLPRLPREVIGKPDTDWMWMGVNVKGNTLLKQMEGQLDEVEAQVLARFGDRVLYTFSQVGGPNRAWIMTRLRDKADMRAFWKELGEAFGNTPFMEFDMGPWNPAELPIPDPPQLRVAVRGGTAPARAHLAQAVEQGLKEQHVFPRVSTLPSADREESIIIRPHQENWALLQAKGVRLTAEDLADLARVATDGRKLGTLEIGGRQTSIMMGFPDRSVRSAEDLGALAVGVGGKLLPMTALASVNIEQVPPKTYREDQREVALITGRKDEGQALDVPAALAKAREIVDGVRSSPLGKRHADVTLSIEDAERELTDALRQLGVAVALSILLIFLTLVIQFGSLANAALVLVAVPLGLIGVLASLFAFGSTLSLNSVLGVILLNGIAVANSIILVDFIKRRVDAGLDPRAAAVEAGRKRLRPILITSLTTILGMLPIALGFGEGGRILQPLGIAVSGGLWVSMALTLFIVPALQASYLGWLARRRGAEPAVIARGELLQAGTQVLAEPSPAALILPVDPPRPEQLQ